jgi:hypothetical protein
MGFASAFASGLIKGFHQNILNEQKARAKDEEKLDSYRQLLMKSVLSGDDVNTSAINAVKDMIKSGEKQLEDREGIDIFGRPSERLKIDMLDMAGFVNGTNDTIMIGNVAFPKPKNYDDTSVVGKPGVRASMIFDKLNSLGKNKIQTMFSNSEDLMALKNFYDANVSFFLKDQVFVKDQKGIVLHKGPSELIPVHNWMKTLVPLKGKSLLKDSEFLLPTGFKNVLGDAEAITNAQKLGLDNDELKSLSGLAELQGYKDLGEFIYTSANLYTKPVDFIEGINHTAALFKLNAHQPRSLAEKSAIGKYLMDEGFDDRPLAAAYAMTPLVLNKADIATRELKQYGMIPKQSKDNLNESWKRLTGKTLDKFDEIFRATRESEVKMLKYVDLLQQARLKPETFVTETYKFFRSIFGETGTVKQVMSLIKGVDDTNRAAITEMLERDWGSIDKSTDEGKLQAEIAVLKYTIAADLARAEDENGRLSDQDLQRNLNKLGTFGFGELEDARTSAKTVLFDVQRRLKNLTVIGEVRDRSQANQFISFADRRLLQGDRMARSALLQFKRDNPVVAQATESASQININDVLDVEKYEFEPDLVGNEGEAIYQNKQTRNYVIVNRNEGKVTKVLPASKLLNFAKYSQEGGNFEGELNMGDYDPTKPPVGSGGASSSPPPNQVSEVDITDGANIETRPDGKYLNGRKGREELRGTPPNQRVIFIYE